MDDDQTLKLIEVTATPTTTHFLGYQLLENFLKDARQDAGPLYVLLTRKPALDVDYGEPMFYATLLTVQSLAAGGIVRYWRYTLAKTLFLNGEPFDDKAYEKHERSKAAHAMLLEFLEEEGFQVEEASFAMPKNLHFTAGRANFWRYEQTLDRFIRVPQQLDKLSE